MIGPVTENEHSVTIAFVGTNFLIEDRCFTGSLAEFYITPVICCIGDVDIMYNHFKDSCISMNAFLEHKRTTNIDRIFIILFSRMDLS